VVLERYYPGRSTSYATIPLSIGEAIKAAMANPVKTLRSE
jgi:hypothetical protein